MSNKTLSYFVCQRCSQPLRLDASIENISSQQLNNIKASSSDIKLNASNNSPSNFYRDQDQQAECHIVFSPNNPESTRLIEPSEVESDDLDSNVDFRSEKSATGVCSAQKDVLDSNDLEDKINQASDVNKRLEDSEAGPRSAQSMAFESLMDVVAEYALVGDSQLNTDETLSTKMRVIGELFDILSGQTEIDHPLCEECTDQLLDQLDQQLKQTEEESNIYSNYLNSLSTEKLENEDELLQQINQLHVEEEELKSELSAIVKEHDDIEAQIEEEKLVAKKLQEEEIRYYKEYNNYKRQLYEYEDAQKSIENQLKYTKRQLEKFKKINIFNVTFHIWHSGHLGTINGFRLGRLPNVQIEWNEINAGWGQASLLLYSLAKRKELIFQRYRIIPYGNFSHIEVLGEKNKELPLYYSGGIKFFWDHKFDQAMVAFLDCLQQFKETLEKRNKDCCLPYNMDKGRIEDPNTGSSYSIKLQFNSEEQWTKALKFMLTNLKWALVFVTSDDVTAQ